jgi:hypothetical protein
MPLAVSALMRLSESLAKRSAVLSAISSIGPTHDPLRPSGPGRHAVAYLKHLDALSERESLREAGRVEVEVLGGDGCRLRGGLERARHGGAGAGEDDRSCDLSAGAAVLVPKELNVAVEQKTPGGLDVEEWQILRRVVDLIQASEGRRAGPVEKIENAPRADQAKLIEAQ